MLEFITSIWLAVTSALGFHSEAPEKPVEKVEQSYKSNSSIEEKEAPEGSQKVDKKPLSEREQSSTQAEVPYQSPKDAPWVGKVQGSDIISEKKNTGKPGEVSTIFGNGTKGQNETQMDGPRKLQLDSKKNIWFIDGDQRNAKLRKYDGKQIHNVLDLVNNKTIDAKGYFMASGLAIIHDNVYISSVDELYKVENNTLQPVSGKIRSYMKENNMEYIYRMRAYKDDIYLMLMSKGNRFAFAKYNTKTQSISQVTEAKQYGSPYNFYVHKDNEIMIATELGYVVWEKLNPRQTEYIDFKDNQTKVADVWVDDKRNLYMVTWEEQVKAMVYMDKPGDGWNNTEVLAGNRRGFVDGYKNEVEMDNPIDFIWDGSGYIFADSGNNAIRKLWWNEPPSDK